MNLQTETYAHIAARPGASWPSRDMTMQDGQRHPGESIVMRDGLRFMPEGSGKFEVVWARRDGAETVVVRAVRNGLLDD